MVSICMSMTEEERLIEIKRVMACRIENSISQKRQRIPAPGLNMVHKSTTRSKAKHHPDVHKSLLHRSDKYIQRYFLKILAEVVLG